MQNSILEKPKVLRDDNGRMHCLDGPCLSYTDGWEIFAVRGFQMKKQWIVDKLPIEEIQNFVINRDSFVGAEALSLEERNAYIELYNFQNPGNNYKL